VTEPIHLRAGSGSAEAGEIATVARPSWLDDLITEVDAAFVVTGAATPGWPDPHPDRAPLDEEYSRCLDPGKYRIVAARLAAWRQVLVERDLVRFSEEPASEWINDLRSAEHRPTELHFVPLHTGGLTLVAATTLVAEEPFGIDLAISSAQGTVRLASLPDCGCDACDSGSADLLTFLDDWVSQVAMGGVLHARSGTSDITRCPGGWMATGPRPDPRWIDERTPAPRKVQRWTGRSWL
jgi:hypothetical protein